MATGILNKTKGKQHSQSAIVYDTFAYYQFTDVTGVGNGVASTAIQVCVPSPYIVLPVAFKCYGIWVTFFNGTLPVANASFNICASATAAEAGTIAPNDNSDAGTTPPTTATSGQTMFLADQRLDNISGLTTKVPVLFTPDNPDAIYAKGTVLTLRYVTNGSGTVTASTSLPAQYVLFGKNYDINPSKPINAQLNPATDL